MIAMRAQPISSIIAATIVCCCATTVEAVELPREMNSQYRTAVERLKQVYAHATISGTLKHELPQQNKFRDQQFIFRAAGPDRRIDLTTTAQRGMGFDVGATDMYMGAPYASLQTYRGPTSQVFDTADELSYQAAKSRIDDACPLDKICSLGNRGTVLDLLGSQGVTITSVKKLTSKGTPLVKIGFQETGRNPNAAESSSWVTLSPTEGWAVRSYHRTTGHGASEVTFRGTITYSGMHEGAPLIQHMETWQEQGPQKTCIQHDVVQVSDFSTEEPDHDYFAAFGLGPGRDPK
jgi:hypothetical protein